MLPTHLHATTAVARFCCLICYFESKVFLQHMYCSTGACYTLSALHRGLNYFRSSSHHQLSAHRHHRLSTQLHLIANALNKPSALDNTIPTTLKPALIDKLKTGKSLQHTPITRRSSHFLVADTAVVRGAEEVVWSDSVSMSGVAVFCPEIAVELVRHVVEDTRLLPNDRIVGRMQIHGLEATQV